MSFIGNYIRINIQKSFHIIAAAAISLIYFTNKVSSIYKLIFSLSLNATLPRKTLEQYHGYYCNRNNYSNCRCISMSKNSFLKTFNTKVVSSYEFIPPQPKTNKQNNNKKETWLFLRDLS